MADDRNELLKELTEARDKVQRQIELMSTTAPPFGVRYRELQVGPLKNELTRQLCELNECISNLQRPNS